MECGGWVGWDGNSPFPFLDDFNKDGSPIRENQMRGTPILESIDGNENGKIVSLGIPSHP